ncbi:hypothetical protein [Methylocystis parvus]|uniref:Glycosyltransferase RgtA/B/C/D-like domain-containing protein n=1 Tax=Methylocystis parvus TaxID=134 RepID=A0A6B8MCK9_9HYPH|nr:hypothetical protein [Methylocystis parvus]QGM99053.1 hypothetical protein F7D14_17225 [Methylocystis parvus]WBK00580.1 hypothetical protein MMG94_02315 [Methylocystis parvus OBBP]
MTLPVGLGDGQGAMRPFPSWLRRPIKWIVSLIGPDARILENDREPSSIDWDIVAGIALAMAAGLILVAFGHGAGRRGDGALTFLYWIGLIVMTAPAALRLASPDVRRDERLMLSIALGLALLLFKMLYAPTAFAHFDEFLHWSTALDLMASHRLFTPNPLLPVSPFYPALEIFTTSIASLTHLSIFASATIVLIVARCLLVAGLFLLFEKCLASARMGGIACLLFMTNSNFIFFEGQFAYETLAIGWLASILYVEWARPQSDDPWRDRLYLTFPLLAALTVTHHLTAYILAGLLLAFAILEMLKREPSGDRNLRVVVAGMAIVLPALWSWRVGSVSQGGSLAHYLGPVLESGVREFWSFLQGGLRGRKLFVAADGIETPIWMRIASLAAALLAALGIAGGFFSVIAASAKGADWRAVVRVIHGLWTDSRKLLLALLGITFPVSLLLRFTSSGWEIGNRMTPFVYIGVAVLSCVTLMRILARRDRARVRKIAAGLVVLSLLGGGLVSGWGIACIRRAYAVSADALSIEPMAIAAARWMSDWLGAGNRVAADRVNTLLVTVYGSQTPITQLRDKVNTSSIFMDKTFSDFDDWALHHGRVDYLFVDLRLTTGLPRLGVYFDKGEYRPSQSSPPAASSFLKFNAMKGVSRIFDNGSIVIYDVRGVHDALWSQ